MSQVNIVGGPLKRELIQQAYAELGLAGYEWELTPEEFDVAVRRLDAMLAEWQAAYSIDLGYNWPLPNGTRADDESGLALATVQAVVTGLAVRLAPTLGKQVSAETRAAAATSFAMLRNAYTCVPAMQPDRRTPAGAGNRRYGLNQTLLGPARRNRPTVYVDGGLPVKF